MGEFLDNLAAETAQRQRDDATTATGIGASAGDAAKDVAEGVGLASLVSSLGSVGDFAGLAVIGAIIFGAGGDEVKSTLLNAVTFGGLDRRAADLFEAETGQIQEVNRVNAIEQIARARESSAQAASKLSAQSIL